MASLLMPAALTAHAQTPRINTLFPIGGKAGETIEAEIRGSNIDGADKLLVTGVGISGTVDPGGAKVDETNKPLWQSKCQSCHELRSPANRSMSTAQWAATVERMVKVRQAPISADETAKITQYLVAAARAGRVTAKIKIEPGTMPELAEIRVVTPRGVSTAGLFEVGNLPEVMAAPGKFDQAQPITLPCVANGTVQGNAEKHFFKFAAVKGQRYVFDLKAFRYSYLTQEFFNPDLRLYDSSGKQLVENHGHYELDPLIDWTCQDAGDYVLEVRDLLGRGNPGSVYRLSMGAVPYDTVVYPPAGRASAKVALQVSGKDMDGQKTNFSTTAPAHLGVTTVSSPFGPMPFYASSYPVVTASTRVKTTALPAGFAGRMAQQGAHDEFQIQGEGRWEFEVFAARLSSPANVRVTLLNEKGGGITGTNGDNRMAADLVAGKTYTLKVEETDDKNGADFVYFVEARPAAAIVTGVIRPGNISLRPGSKTVAEVILTRRENTVGDITVSAEGLPSGVTMSPVAIQPDRDRAFVVLNADANAGPVDGAVNIRLTGKSAKGEITSLAIPQEEYRINNDPRYYDRAQCVVAVRGKADFTGSVEDSIIKVHPRKGVNVKIKVQRRAGYTGALYVRMDGLPLGWTANADTIPGDRNEITILVRPDGNNTQPFLKRDPTWTQISAVVEVYEDNVPYVIGIVPVAKADKIADDEKND